MQFSDGVSLTSRPTCGNGGVGLAFRWESNSGTHGTGGRPCAGLPGHTEKKNGWLLAKEMNDPKSGGVQHLLPTVCRDAGGVGDQLLRDVAESLGYPGGKLIEDENGFLKKRAPRP